MKYLGIIFIAVGCLMPHFLYAATVTFSVIPSTATGDGAVIIEAVILPDPGDVGAINALEGRIGILGEGSFAVTDVGIETGDSVFSLWPELPHFDTAARIIRFTGGAPEPLTAEGRILRLRIFTTDDAPITLSWLGGAAYAANGVGTPVGVSSRSLVVTPKAGVPNLISATSPDTKPPVIESILIANDPDLFDGQYFLSVLAIDDMTGISHVEVVEDGVMTRVETGSPYVLKDHRRRERLFVTVYDKAGNSVSTRAPGKPSGPVYFLGGLLFGVVILTVVFVRLLRTKQKR